MWDRIIFKVALYSGQYGNTVLTQHNEATSDRL